MKVRVCVCVCVRGSCIVYRYAYGDAPATPRCGVLFPIIFLSLSLSDFLTLNHKPYFNPKPLLHLRSVPTSSSDSNSQRRRRTASSLANTRSTVASEQPRRQSRRLLASTSLLCAWLVRSSIPELICRFQVVAGSIFRTVSNSCGNSTSHPRQGVSVTGARSPGWPQTSIT